MITNEEQAAYEQARRDYFMVEGKEKQAQDALNRASTTMITNEQQGDHLHGQEEKTMLHEWAGIKFYGGAEYPAFSDPTKPDHYNDTAITPFQVIDNWNLDFYLGNTVKYLCRREKKGNELDDLRKALAYLQEKIRILEAQ